MRCLPFKLGGLKVTSRRKPEIIEIPSTIVDYGRCTKEALGISSQVAFDSFKIYFLKAKARNLTERSNELN